MKVSVDEPFLLADWTIDPESLIVSRGQDKHRLEAKSMAVLLHLKNRAPHFVSSQELLSVVWPDVIVVDNVVHRSIAILRKTFGDQPNHPKFIETLPGRGYRLIAPMVGIQPDRDLLPITIAVLPLRNLSEHPDQDYLGDAISSEIWSKLTKLDGIRIISMTSSRIYRDSKLDVREIGARLTADFIVEGDAIRSEDLARINVVLTETRGGLELWGRSYTKSLDGTSGLFSLYDEISEEIRAALPAQIRGNANHVESSPSLPTENIDAYNLVKKAEWEWERTFDPRRPLQLAEQAVYLDPDYADEHSAISGYLRMHAEFGYGPSINYLLASEAAVTRALLLDSNRGNTYANRAYLYDRLDLDWRRAMKSYEKASALGAYPDLVAGMMQDILLNAGLYERGLELVTNAAARNPGRGEFPLYMGRFLYRMGRIEEALQRFHQSLRLAQENVLIVYTAALHLIWLRELDRAEEIANKYFPRVRGLRAGWGGRYLAALVAMSREDREPLRRLINEWVAHRDKRYVPAAIISQSLYELGAYDEHIRWFAIRVEERSLVGFVMDELRRLPDYWDRLQEWALSEPGGGHERLDLLNDHTDLFHRTTKGFVL